MPLKTFFYLPNDKRNLIISISIHEFSIANYNTASINQICKKSNVAKGSFYQYFTDMLDLNVYIMTLAIQEKIKFFSSILVEFYTLTLLEQFFKDSDESAKLSVIKKGGRQSESLFMQMIHNAKSKGEIDSRVNLLALRKLLQFLNSAVN